MARINANLNANTKMVADMKAENSELKVPLEAKRQERDNLKNLLKQHPKVKTMTIKNI
jgi:growth arrest-specific protein 8